MAGSPLKRAKREQQQLAAIGHDGQQLQPLKMCRALPAEWMRWTDAQKIRHLFGMSLERAHDYLALGPVETLDPHLQASQREAMRLIVVTCRDTATTAQREETRRMLIEQIAKAATDTGARARAVDIAPDPTPDHPASQQNGAESPASQRSNGARNDQAVET
jgi:hypothetical protein